MNLDTKKLDLYKSLSKIAQTAGHKHLDHYFTYLLVKESKETKTAIKLDPRICENCGRRFQQLNTDFELKENNNGNETIETCSKCNKVFKTHKAALQKVKDMYGIGKEKRDSIETFRHAVEVNKKPKPNSFNLYNFLKHV